MSKPAIEDACMNCDNGGWVCENHTGKPWGGTSVRDDACGCGAGCPCPVCQFELAISGQISRYVAALNGVLWMAEQWLEYTGSSAMNSDEYQAAIDAANALLAEKSS